MTLSALQIVEYNLQQCKKVMIKCVIHTTKACITLSKSITSSEAGYSSKTIAQQLAVVIWVVLVFFVHCLDEES